MRKARTFTTLYLNSLYKMIQKIKKGAECVLMAATGHVSVTDFNHTYRNLIKFIFKTYFDYANSYANLMIYERYVRP